MELWVRSQDKKRLISVTNLYIPISRNGEDFSIYTFDTDVMLGTYKTEERALEVLDEIQNFMRDYACAKKINILGGEINMIPKPILIYNMPKK